MLFLPIPSGADLDPVLARLEGGGNPPLPEHGREIGMQATMTVFIRIIFLRRSTSKSRPVRRLLSLSS